MLCFWHCTGVEIPLHRVLYNCHKPPKTLATPRSSALLLVYQSSHPGMTEMGEKTALPQSTTNNRVSKKICYFYMNLFTNDV